MTKFLKILGVGVLAAGVTACSSSQSPVAPSRTTADTGGADAGGVSTAARPDFAVGAKPGDLTIVGLVLQEDGEFDVLHAAGRTAGLVDALNGTRPLPVFARPKRLLGTLGWR